MAYLGILPEAPSFSTQLARGLGSGIGSGINQGISLAEKLAGTRQRQTAARDKLASRAWEKTPRYLKAYHPSLSGNPKAEQEVADFAAKILRSDPNISEDEAFSMAADAYKKSRKSAPEEDEGYFEKRRRKEEGGGEGLLERIVNSLSPTKEDIGPETPEEALKRQKRGRFTKEERSAREYPFGLASMIKKSPAKTAGYLGAGVVEPIESLSSFLGGTLPSEWFGQEKGSSRTPLSDFIKRKLGFEELSSEGKSYAETAAGLGSVIPFEGLVESTASKFLNRGTQAGIKAAKEAFVGKKVAEETIPGVKEATKPLQGRVAKEVPISATESRMERMSPRERLFETKQQQKVLESQLKQYPKYAEDISKDAAEMAARREKILGPKALETKAQKIEYYSKQLPAVQKDYEKAISRVRALEDQMVKQPELADKIKPLIQAATKQLEESQFLLKQTLNNAKTGSSKVGIEAMREAAQKKVLEISEKIGANEEILLKKADYNPEFIRQARQLEKKKPLPSTHIDDYFTQVHDGYAKVYKDRIAQLNQEITKLAENRTLSSLHSRQQLNKERVELQKLVDHVDAENAIHRHKLALRQIHERKLAQERLGNFRPIEGKPKVGETAKPQIKEVGRIAESMKTSEGRAKLADDLTDKISKQAKDPKISEKIQSEKGKLKETLEEISRKTEEISNKSSKTASSTKESVKIGKSIAKDIQDLAEALPKGISAIWSTRLGRDLIIGTAVPVIQEIFKEWDIPISSSSILSASIGNPRGAGYRALATSIIKFSIKKYKKETLKSAIRKEDDQKVVNLQKKYGNKLTKEAKQELYGT